MSIQVTPIPRLTAFAAPALVLGVANAAGTAETTLSTDSTLLAFDTTLPAAVGTAATGSATVTARRDHVHSGTTQATQSALEAETNEDTYAAPDLIRYSPGVGKVWLQWEQTGAHSMLASYNMTSVTDGGDVGASDLLWDADFANGYYAMAAMAPADKVIMCSGAIATTGVTLSTRDLAGAKSDMIDCQLMVLGVQA